MMMDILNICKKKYIIKYECVFEVCGYVGGAVQGGKWTCTGWVQGEARIEAKAEE